MIDLTTIIGMSIAGLLLTAAWYDIATRLIPDMLPAGIAILGLLARASLGMAELAASLAVAAALFVVLIAAVAWGRFGGGDAKLCAALALGLPPAATLDFVVVTVMVGGVLGVAYLAGPMLVRPARLAPAGATLLRRILFVEHWRLRRRGPLPYAVAIAVGGIFVHLPPTGG